VASAVTAENAAALLVGLRSKRVPSKKGILAKDPELNISEEQSSMPEVYVGFVRVF
jgi:hypothetical protein